MVFIVLFAWVTFRTSGLLVGLFGLDCERIDLTMFCCICLMSYMCCSSVMVTFVVSSVSVLTNAVFIVVSVELTTGMTTNCHGSLGSTDMFIVETSLDVMSVVIALAL